jgi:hypothetical protein
MQVAKVPHPITVANPASRLLAVSGLPLFVCQFVFSALHLDCSLPAYPERPETLLAVTLYVS